MFGHIVPLLLIAHRISEANILVAETSEGLVNGLASFRNELVDECEVLYGYLRHDKRGVRGTPEMLVGLNHPCRTSNRNFTLPEYSSIMSISLNTEGWIQQVASRGLLDGLVVQWNYHNQPLVNSSSLWATTFGKCRPHNRVLTANSRGKEQNMLQYLLHPKLLNQMVPWHLKPLAAAPSNLGYDYRSHHFSFVYSWILFAPLFGRWSLAQTTNLPTILFSFCVHPNDIMWLIVLPTSRLRAENRSQWGQILPSRLPWWVCSENLLQSIQIALIVPNVSSKISAKSPSLNWTQCRNNLSMEQSSEDTFTTPTSAAPSSSHLGATEQLSANIIFCC